jgi:hypothetical protein
MEKKNYYVVDLMHVEGIDKTPPELNVVDCVHKRILYYCMSDDCKDVTVRTKRIYETDKDKMWSERRIGCDLVKLMDGKSIDSKSSILLATDNPREVIRKVAGVRAKWYAVHAKSLERTASSESAGWDETATEDFLAEQFTNL